MALFANLSRDEKQRLKHWRAIVNGEIEDRHCGLWAYGNRFSGSSYVANVAWLKLTGEHPEWTAQYHNAKVLMENIRDYWQLGQDPNRGQSEELTQDYYALDDALHKLWESTDLVWLDDLHDTLDLRFWLRHIQPDLERRVKAGRPTIVSGNIPPNHPEFVTIQRVIEGLFVVTMSDYA